MSDVIAHKKKNWFLRHKILTTLLVLIIIGISVSVTNANKVTITTSPTTASAPSTSKSTSNVTTKPAAATAHVGATLSLKDQDGYTADVTVVKMVDPAQSDNQYITPDAGKRFVGVQLKITNTATKANDGFYPDNDVTLIDSQGQSYETYISDISNCQSFASDATKLAPGESALGCVTFQVPETATVAKVKYTPSSGFSSNTGSWLVP